MLKLQIKEKEIENLTPEEKFVRGTVGAKCQINFDEFWQGYEKYIVFKRVGYEPINIMVDSLENEIEIPYTILSESGEFKIGVFGITETETLPTLYSKDIKILYGTDTHGTTPPTYIPSEIDQLRLSKQDKLVSGENIKTVNGESVLGSGNIKIQVEVDQTYDPDSTNAQSGKAVAEAVAIEQNRADNTFANALKGSKSDTIVSLDDVSPVTHNMRVKILSNTITDLTTVKVSRCGKNLIPYPYANTTKTISGVTFTVHPNGSITVNGTATADIIFFLCNVSNYTIYKGTYTLSGCPSGGSNTTYCQVLGSSDFMDIGNGVTRTYSQDIKQNIFIKIFSGYTADNLVFKPQIELGSTATPYEPYQGQTYTPTADGTVEDVTSLYPNTTLMTDTEGVIIDCEYNRDINKEINDREEADTILQNGITANKTLIQKEIGDRKSADTTLQTNIDKKVDKMIGAGDMVYAVDIDGTNVGIFYTENNTSYSILRRDENGRASITAPLLDTEIANKKYVDDTVASQVSSVYKAKGSVADLSSLPTPDKAHEGFVYNIENEFTTTDLFVEGVGKTYPAGTNVVIVNTTGTEYKYDVLAGMVDLSSYATKTELSGKVDKVSKDHIVYANENTNVQKPITYTSTPSQYTIVYRSANGVTSVGTPTKNTHATPKSYVDNADALKMNKSAFDYNDTTKTLTIDIF